VIQSERALKQRKNENALNAKDLLTKKVNAKENAGCIDTRYISIKYITLTMHNITTLRNIACNRRNHSLRRAAALASATFDGFMFASPCFPASSVALRFMGAGLARLDSN
jgi:hypothetical protein